MDELFSAELRQLRREVSHWRQAALRLESLEMLAAPINWRHLERDTGVEIRNSLLGAVERLGIAGNALRTDHLNYGDKESLIRMRGMLNNFRKQYLKTEITINLYTDAINTRGHKKIGLLLSAYDSLARKSMQSLLKPLGYHAPPVLTYIDNGRGASIAKAGMRLWDGGTINPCAVIKIVLHNLYRNTSLIHETGHQVAHITGWNGELAHVLEEGLRPFSTELSEVWSSWSSEIAADAYGFVHTGYASVAGLHDVVSGDARSSFRYIPRDPHPISYLRVLLGIEMCRAYFGKGAWDEMRLAWVARHPMSVANQETRKLIMASLPLIHKIVDMTLKTDMQAFRSNSLEYWINPQYVHPTILQKFVNEYGDSAFSSRYWINKEPLKLLAISALDTGYRTNYGVRRQEKWLLQLGNQTISNPNNTMTIGV